MKGRIKWKNLLFFLLGFIFFIGVHFSIYNVLKWIFDSKKSAKHLNEIQEIISINEIEDTTTTEIIEQEEIPKANPYWDYIKIPLIDVDFNDLKEKNNQTKGWIQVSGTNINYPFVQSNDNSYYLNRSFDKKYNDAGWIFLDYRNKLDGSDKNTILYAHARKDNTMFGSLKNILKSDWVNNPNNFIVKLSTEYENTLWQVFSVYNIPTTSDYIQTTFIDDEYEVLLNTLINRSNFNFNTSINKNDYILTLSTCYTNNEKVVLHAKLIKRDLK